MKKIIIIATILIALPITALSALKPTQGNWQEIFTDKSKNIYYIAPDTLYTWKETGTVFSDIWVKQILGDQAKYELRTKATTYAEREKLRDADAMLMHVEINPRYGQYRIFAKIVYDAKGDVIYEDHSAENIKWQRYWKNSFPKALEDALGQITGKK